MSKCTWYASCKAKIKCQARPLRIYTSTKNEESFITALQRNDGADKHHEVKLVRSSVFSYEQAWHRLVYLQVSRMDEGLSFKQRICFLNSLMDIGKSSSKWRSSRYTRE